MAIETILLAVGKDDEERVNRLGQTAADIAGPAGATVAIARIFTTDEYDRVRDQLNYDRDSEVTPDLVADRNVAVRDVEQILDDADVEYSVYGRTTAKAGVGESIIKLAEEVDAGLVIVGGRNRSPTGKAVFGSTAQEVMLGAPCPVTFVRTGD